MAFMGEMHYLTIGGKTYKLPSSGGSGTVTSVGVTNATNGGLSVSGSPITSSGTITIGLASGYGDTKNPYASKTKNYVLAAPATANGVPTFRALVAADIPISDWAKASTKPSYNFSEIGSKPTTLSGYGITDAYTKTQVDGLVSGVLHYKGTKATVSALPTSGNTTGDVWHVTADGSEWAWDGSAWQELGTAVDLSGYAQLSGASFTGPVTFGDSVTADELETGDLVVTGAASFTNNISANTINGVTVGNSPKFTDTTYSSLTAANGGTAVSLVTTGEKYTWNNKQDKLTNPVTGTGTSGYLAKWNGTGSITNGPQLGSTTTTYLNNAGSWATPPGTATGHTHSLSIAASTGTSSISLAANTKYQLSAGNNTYIFTTPSVPTKTSDLTNDGDGTSAFATMADIGSFGGGTITEVKTNAGSHTTIDVTSGKAEFNIPTKTSHLTNDSNFITSSVIGFSNLTSDSATITLNGVGYSFSRTDTKLQVEDLTTNYTSSVTHRVVLRSNGTTAATGYISNIYFSHVGGSTSSQGYAGLILGNEKATGTNGNSTGKLTLYASNDKYTQIITNTLTNNNVVTLPSGTGILALTSEIPSSTGSSTTGITASTTATKTTLGTAFTIPNVTSAGSASTWTFEEVSIPNVTAAGSASTWTFEEVSIPNVTAAGSASTWTFGSTTVGDGTLVGAVDSSDTSMLVITAGTKSVQQKTGGANGTAPTIGTAIKVQSKKSGANGTAPTIGTAIKVQSKKSGANGSAPTLGTAFTVPNVTGNTSATVSISDSGHTHTLS